MIILLVLEFYKRKTNKIIKGIQVQNKQSKVNKQTNENNTYETMIVQITMWDINHRTGMKCTGSFYKRRI